MTKIKLNHRLQSQINKISGDIETKKSEIIDLQKQLDKLKDQWTEVSRESCEVLNDTLICPIYRRTLDIKGITSEKYELEIEFNKNKDNKLRIIHNLGKEKSGMIKQLSKELAELNDQLSQFKSKLLMCDEIFEINRLKA